MQNPVSKSVTNQNFWNRSTFSESEPLFDGQNPCKDLSAKYWVNADEKTTYETMIYTQLTRNNPDLSIYLSIYLPTYLPIYLSIYLSN